MKGYVVCVYKSISNQEKLKEYAIKARKAVEKFKGTFLIRGGKATANEGDKSPRTVVIEFSSYAEANLFYNSKEYQDAHEILKGNVVRHHQTVEGI
ncbi:MAG: DUF1330 domain-containing protein [Candidatus Pelagibacter sp. TMED272]|nr:hypothetical protein [Pelagibacteraceae bacterium]RPG93473.1 MAG: DUF1330 domain-containing protein [Candidatus Pelagibacter sp. TMED272]|tara:strand:+ start:5905 stop:6192 length:288 start_codon:yes stop_codon:yes gene_type:complete